MSKGFLLVPLGQITVILPRTMLKFEFFKSNNIIEIENKQTPM